MSRTGRRPRSAERRPVRAVRAFATYRLFVTVMVLASQVAQQAQAVAIGWDVYERTGSPLALGWIGLVQFIPVLAFFLSPPGRSGRPA